MELALTCTNSFPIRILNEDLKHGLNSLEDHVSLTIKQAKQSLRGDSLTIPKSNAKNKTHFLQSLHTIPTTQQELPIFFFLFCAKLLHNKSLTKAPTCAQDKKIRNSNSPKDKEKWANWVASATLKNPNLMPAIKFSLSLGLVVFMGLVYSKENGFWAGLPIAVSYVSGREATFKAANAKAHGSYLRISCPLDSCLSFLGSFSLASFSEVKCMGLLLAFPQLLGPF